MSNKNPIEDYLVWEGGESLHQLIYLKSNLLHPQSEIQEFTFDSRRAAHGYDLCGKCCP